MACNALQMHPTQHVATNLITARHTHPGHGLIKCKAAGLACQLCFPFLPQQSSQEVAFVKMCTVCFLVVLEPLSHGYVILAFKMYLWTMAAGTHLQKCDAEPGHDSDTMCTVTWQMRSTSQLELF